jgi:hypothetical protein
VDVFLTRLFATHADILTSIRSRDPSQVPFTAEWNAPLPPLFTEGPTVSAPGLSPGTFSAQGRSTSELLRTLSMMAASKPTSWLSERPHIL